MSAEAHFFALLFALPAGILSYLIFTMPDHHRLGMRHLLAVVLLFIVPIVGMPEIAGGTVLYYGAGFVLTWRVRRWDREQRTKPPPDPDPPETDDEGQPIIFPDQRRDE